MEVIINFIKSFFHELFYLTSEMGIYLLLGFLIAGLIHAFLPESFINKHIGKRGFLSSFKSSLLGVPLPLCSCGVVPTALSLKKSGASNGAVVSFLISTPQTGMDSIAATYSLLGGFFAFFRVVVAFITGVIGGFITDLFSKQKSGDLNSNTNGFINKSIDKISCCSEVNNGYCGTELKKGGFFYRLKTVFSYGFGELLESIAGWIALGLVIGALISVVVPDNFFSLYLSNRFVMYLLILAVSAPLYICATGSIPIASSLILKGISPGAAFIFLMAGPATNSVTFTVLYKTIGRKSTFFYIGTIILGAIAGGFLIDYLFFDVAMKQIAANQSVSSISLIKTIGGVVFGFLLLKALLFKKKEECGCSDGKSERCSVKEEDSFVYKVKGMTCNHCKITVSKIVENIKGVKNYSINLEKGELLVTGDFDLESLKSSLKEYGYSIE